MEGWVDVSFASPYRTLGKMPSKAKSYFNNVWTRSLSSRSKTNRRTSRDVAPQSTIRRS